MVSNSHVSLSANMVVAVKLNTKHYQIDIACVQLVSESPTTHNNEKFQKLKKKKKR